MTTQLHILKGNTVFQTLKGHFIFDQYLSVLMTESYTSTQEDITRKSELDNLFSNLKNGV